jgi:hypothetical protein
MHPLSFYVKYIFFNHFLQVSPYVKTKWHSYLMEVVSNLNQITLPYISLWKKYYFRSYLHLLISSNQRKTGYVKTKEAPFIVWSRNSS